MIEGFGDIRPSSPPRTSTVDQHFKWEGWMVTYLAFGYISNRGNKSCPVGITDGWDFQLPSGWQADPTFRVSCEGSTPPPK